MPPFAPPLKETLMSSANVHCERDLAHPDNPQRNEAGTHLLLDQGHQLR